MPFLYLSHIQKIFSNIIKLLRAITFIFRYRSILRYRKIFLIFLACIGESGVSLIGLGKILDTVSEFFIYSFASSILATFVDFSIMLTFRKIFKSYSERISGRESRFMSFCRKHSTLGTMFYRFIPFSRMPFLATASVVIDIKKFIFTNFLGAILWSVFWTYVGYNSLGKILIDKIYFFSLFISNKLYSLFSLR